MIENIVDQAVGYLQDWTKKEFLAMLAENSKPGADPLIVKFGGQGYLIGNYALQPMNQNWWRVSYRFNDDEIVFSNKMAALCYILYRRDNRYHQADQVLKNDAEVCRWTVKSEQYYYRFKQARKKKKFEKSDLFLDRYQETVFKLNQSKALLEKSLRSAKYFKM